MKKYSIFFLTLFLVFVFLLTIKGSVGNPNPKQIEDNLETRGEPFELSPERGRYAITMSLAQNKSVYLTAEIAKFTVPDLGIVNGKYIAFFPPGPSIMAVPFYLVGEKINLAQVSTFTLTAIFAIVNFLLIVKLSKQLNLSKTSGQIAALAYLLATPAFPYSVSFYQHQITAFLLLAATLLLFSKVDFIKLMLAAFISGMSFWIDSQNPIFFIPLAYYGVTRLVNIMRNNEELSISINLKLSFAIAGAILAIITYVAYSYYTFNKPLQFSGTGRGVSSFDGQNLPILKPSEAPKDPLKFFSPRRMLNGSYTLLISEDRGIILYAPVMLLAIFGFRYLCQREQQKSTALLGTIIFIFALYTMWGDPYGGWAFGPRYLIPAFALSSIFLASAFDYLGKRIWFKTLFSVFFIYGVAVSLLGALTTNQVPPKVEAVHLGMKWNYFLNWEMLTSGQTSSFFYKTFLQNNFSLFFYFLIILLLIILVGQILIWSQRSEEIIMK